MKLSLCNSTKALGTCYNDYKTSLLLPTCTNKSCPDLDTIDCRTMADLLMGQYNTKYDKIVIIDCRYQFEFDGGHIRTAINVSRPTDVESIYYQYLKQGRRVCIIFHCEFSSHRGPKMYRHFRNFDRNQNPDKYPHLEYPELYLLEGGYRVFFEHYRELCDPLGYIEMNDPEYIEELKKAHKINAKDSRKFRSRSCSDLLINRSSRKKRPHNEMSGTKANLFGGMSNIFNELDVNEDLIESVSRMVVNVDDENEEVFGGGEGKALLRASHASMPSIDLTYRRL